jgi:hypothetical protein
MCFILKKQIQFYIIFLLSLTSLISCSPKQGNSVNETVKKPVTILQHEPTTSESNSPYSNITVNIVLEKGSKVIYKGKVPDLYFYSLVTYNGNDIYVNTHDLFMMEVVTAQDDKTFDFDYCDYYNNDAIKVYKKCNKESESFFVTRKTLELHKIQGIKDWLYLTPDNLEDDAFGFIYVYDISEKSFYGDIEENKKADDHWKNLFESEYEIIKWRNLFEPEYEIIKRHKNIKRYGPLLTINHNNKTLEFWDAFCQPSHETQNERYFLLDYYPEYNEILITVRYWEGSGICIFNLESEEYRCYISATPYFNRARTHMISLYRYRDEISLQIYAINNGLYNMLEEIVFYGKYVISNEIKSDYTHDGDINIVNVVWLNDNNAQVNLDNSSSILVEIGEKVKITRK